MYILMLHETIDLNANLCFFSFSFGFRVEGAEGFLTVQYSAIAKFAVSGRSIVAKIGITRMFVIYSYLKMIVAHF